MERHPAGVEVGDDTVQIDSQPHRATLRTGARRAVTALALLLAAIACGGDEDSGPVRSYSITLTVDDTMQEYDYLAAEPVDVRVGDEVTFALENTGTLIHDLNLVDPGGSTVARAEPVPAGGSASVTARFDEAGFWRISCFVDDHFVEHQMFTFVEVTDPTP